MNPHGVGDSVWSSHRSCQAAAVRSQLDPHPSYSLQRWKTEMDIYRYSCPLPGFCGQPLFIAIATAHLRRYHGQAGTGTVRSVLR
jgi:hypothetical protein